MSAARQPLDDDFPSGDNWHSLVRDQGYRLFAAGNGSAVVVERMPASPDGLPTPSFALRGSSSGQRPALNPSAGDEQSDFAVLTEVSRAPLAESAPAAGPVAARARQNSPWNAVRTIRPFQGLSSYVSRRAGDHVFFLVRSARALHSVGSVRPHTLDASAVQIGRSLGLGQLELEALRVAGLVCELGIAKPAAPDTFGVRAAGAPEDFAALEAEDPLATAACQFPECAGSPSVVLEMKHYCRDHFIARCYERLDSCSEQINQRPVCDQEAEQMRAFLRACIERSTALTRAPFQQDSLERARLLDIRYTASDLLRRMRRSPRVAESRPVLLRCETPGRPWQEELNTVLISRFGAMLVCRHLVRSEDWLMVERPDTGARSRARMAWRSPAKAGQFSVGLEILDAENFWGLDWKTCLPAPSLPA